MLCCYLDPEKSRSFHDKIRDSRRGSTVDYGISRRRRQNVWVLEKVGSGLSDLEKGYFKQEGKRRKNKAPKGWINDIKEKTVRLMLELPGLQMIQRVPANITVMGPVMGQ